MFSVGMKLFDSNLDLITLANVHTIDTVTETIASELTLCV